MFDKKFKFNSKVDWQNFRSALYSANANYEAGFDGFFWYVKVRGQYEAVA